jgi:nitrate reductase alpha subunit
MDTQTIAVEYPCYPIEQSHRIIQFIFNIEFIDHHGNKSPAYKFAFLVDEKGKIIVGIWIYESYHRDLMSNGVAQTVIITGCIGRTFHIGLYKCGGGGCG